jgi:uncharacterized protein (DUF2141 family)
LLDSLTLSGKVVNIENKQPIKEVAIGLHEISDTLDLKKHKPLYLTYSDDKGLFKFSYLKKGTYFLFALQDKNKNIIFDNQEKTDFIEEISITGESKKPLILELSTSDTSGNKLLSKKPVQQKQILSYRNGIKKYHFKTIHPQDKLHILQDRKKARELTAYPELFNGDTLTYILETTDSLGNELIDTLKIAQIKRDFKKDGSIINATGKDILPGASQLSYSTNKPIKEIQTDSIYVNQSHDFKIELNANRDSLFLIPASDLLHNDTTRISFKKASIIFYDNDSLSPSSFTYTKADPANYSVLEMKIKTKEPNYIIQLLTEDYVVLEEYKNITILTYNYIKPGSYRIRAIVDKNNNGYWDRADPIKGTKAEPIYYYNNDKINLKPNWELKDLMFIF